ncbi:MAG: extracellular solute-binding protein [Treponema sp.]|nr:extracellular solute-binding protein [Treponema sp.]
MKKTTGFAPRVIYAVLAAVLALGLFASCGGGGAKTEETAGTAEPPVEISLAFVFDGVEVPQPGGEIQKLIEAYTNTKLTLNYYSKYGDVYPTLLASGDLPDVTTALDIPLTKDSMKTGVFWDLKPFMADTNNLKNYHPTIVENSSVDGKMIGVPKVRPLVRRTIIYRKDWAGKLGLKEPTNIEELYEFLKAFAYNDPDGNGVKDTYGLSTQTDLGIRFFTFLHGAPNVWEPRNGEFVYHFTTPEYLDGLKFLKRLYDEKILHPEWATIPRNQFNIIFREGKVLGAFHDSTNAFQQLGSPLEEKIPGASVESFTHMKNPKGEIRTMGESGHLGWLAIPKTVPEEKAKKIVKFLDMLADEPMATLMVWGIEGVHYKVEDGKAVMIPEMESKYVDAVRWPFKLPFSTVNYEDYARPGVYSKYVQMQLDVDEEELKYMVPNPVFPLFSQTYAERSQSLDQIVNDASVQFINGMINETQFKAEVAKWKALGGDQVAKEFAEAYAALNK